MLRIVIAFICDVVMAYRFFCYRCADIVITEAKSWLCLTKVTLSYWIEAQTKIM